ncbi:MAG TPA: hypothetical protein VJA94_21245 [Candidatus Angelobacter sp.]
MPVQRQININKKPNGPPGITFDPNPLNANTRDQIFWTNNDSQPHWPGLLNSDGTINTTYFMPNQIAPDSTSPIFSPSVATTGKGGQPLNYKCSIAGHDNETGSINVT